jgi:hypothetical protein
LWFSCISAKKDFQSLHFFNLLEYLK